MGPQRLLVSDIDGTLVGDDEALARFAAWYAAEREGYRLVYATGRHADSVEALIESTDLPEPDAVISAVGTEIHDRDGRPWPGWHDRLADWDHGTVREALREHAWLVPQPDAAQSRVKVSYDVPGLDGGALLAVERTLEAHGLEAIVVYSQSLHLDILPAVAGKGQAARFVASGWGIPGTDVLAFGDSGNDLELFRSGFRGTLVANALPELAAVVDDDVYRSPERYANGVLDGIRHWTAELERSARG